MAKSKGCGCFPLLILLGAAGYGGYYWYEQNKQNTEAEAHELSALEQKTLELRNAEKAAKEAEDSAQKAIAEARLAEENANKAKAKAQKLLEEAQQAEAKARTAEADAKKAAEEALRAQNTAQENETDEDADDAAPPDSDVDGAITEISVIDRLIHALQNKQFSSEYEQLLQTRLLTILPRIAEGEDVNTIIENANGTTALHNACGLGEFEIIVWLLQNGADIRIKTSKGASVLDCIGNDPDGRIRGAIQSVMNEYEEDAGLAREELGPIIVRIQAMKATSSNKLYRTRLLTLLPMIMNGEDVNLTLTETKGNTALHYACGLGDVELVTWLLENGADPNKLTDKGMSPFKCAGGSQIETIQNMLLQYGGTKDGGETNTSSTSADEAFQTGLNLQFGKNGYSKDLAEAVRYYTIAAEQGHAKAQNNLGHMYNEGWGVKSDKSKAFYWYGKAAEQGLPLAQSNYGTCFEFGTGTKKDKAKAIEWYRKAAAQDNASAKKHLKRLKVAP